MISISGVPGSGKSTLARRLADLLNLNVVQFDDYEVLTHRSPDAISEWLSAGAVLDERLAPGYTAAVQAAGPGVVVDGPFGRAWPGLEGRGDLQVWIECPFDIALSRKVNALVQMGRNDPGFSDWIGGWLEAYPSLMHPACHMLRNRIKPISDCALDGLLSPAQLAEQLVAQLRVQR